MPPFSRTLSEYRQKRGLTQKQLAEAIGHTSQFVAALEMEKEGGRSPSFETLRKIVGVLAEEPDKSVNRRIALSLVLSAINLEERMPIPSMVGADRTYYEAVSVAHEVWAITDAFLDSKSWEAEHTAKRLLADDEIRYIFLIPFSTPKWLWNAGLTNLREHGVSEEKLKKQIVIFSLSSCAFPARVRIVDPRSENARGFYLIGSMDGRYQEVCEMPPELLVQTIRAYSALCSKHKQASRDIEGEKELGYLQLLFPPQPDRSEPARQSEEATRGMSQAAGNAVEERELALTY